MKNLENQLKSISKSMASLSKKIEALSKRVEKPKAAKKTAVARKPAAAKAAPAAGGKTVLESVFNVIRRSQNGATIAQLKKKTKLDARQLSNALYKLSKKGRVYAKSRGVYVKK